MAEVQSLRTPEAAEKTPEPAGRRESAVLRYARYASLSVAALLMAADRTAAQSPETAQELTRLVKQLDEDEFVKREAATARIQNIVREALREQTPLSPGYTQFLEPGTKPIPAGNNGATRTYEQHWRLSHISQAMHAEESQAPTRIPAKTYRGPELLETLRRHAGMDVTVDQDLAAKMEQLQLRVTPERNTWCQVVVQLQQALGCGLDLPSRDRVTVRLMTEDMGEAAVRASEHLLALVTPGKDGPEYRVQLDPRLGTVCSLRTVDCNGTFPKPAKVTLSAPSPAWQGQSTPRAVGEATLQSTFTDETPVPDRLMFTNPAPAKTKPDCPTFIAVVASDPKQQDLSWGIPCVFGTQYLMAFPQKEQDGTWTVTVQGGAYGDVPWSNTSSATDRDIYAAVDATAFTLEHHGEPLSYKREPMKVQQRQHTWQLRCDKEPTKLSARLCQGIRTMRLNLPKAD